MKPDIDKVGDFSFSSALEYSQGRNMVELEKYVDQGLKKQKEYAEHEAKEEAKKRALAEQQRAKMQHRQKLMQSIVQVSGDEKPAEEATKEEAKPEAPVEREIPPEGFKMHSKNITGPFVYEQSVNPKKVFGIEFEDIKNTHDTGLASALNEKEPEPQPDPNSWEEWEKRNSALTTEDEEYFDKISI